MADDFTYEAITDEQRKQQAEAFAAQFENERWGHQMALERLQALPAELQDDSYADQVENTQRAIDTLDAGITKQREIIASF